MRNLIFLDNDSEAQSQKDLKFVSNFFKLNNVDISIRNIKIVSDIWKLERDFLYQTILNVDNTIITWSVYTHSIMSNSFTQFTHFLRTAGQYNLKNLIYIDASGCVLKALQRIILNEETKNVYSILKAIQDNNIITSNGKNGKAVKLRVDLSSEQMFREQAILLSNYI